VVEAAVHSPVFFDTSQEECVSVKIRLKKFGAKKRPYFRIVVLDTRQARDGKTIDELGIYHPIEKEGNQVRLNEEKVRSWLAKGALPSDTVRGILNKQNIRLG
jgi:small subunit ribosomal protein S16